MRSGVTGGHGVVSGLRLRIYGQQRLDVRPAQRFTERRHLPCRAGGDAHEDEIVVALGTHQLRALPGLAAAALVAPAAAIADEQRFAMRDLRCRIGLARSGLGGGGRQHSACTAAPHGGHKHCAARNDPLISHFSVARRLPIFRTSTLASVGLEARSCSPAGPSADASAFRPWQPERAGNPPTCAGRRTQGSRGEPAAPLFRGVNRTYSSV